MEYKIITLSRELEILKGFNVLANTYPYVTLVGKIQMKYYFYLHSVFFF